MGRMNEIAMFIQEGYTSIEIATALKLEQKMVEEICKKNI
jgi:DNA-binding NarL/FixJ family response regulator